MAWHTKSRGKSRREEWARENERKICKNRFSDVGYRLHGYKFFDLHFFVLQNTNVKWIARPADGGMRRCAFAFKVQRDYVTIPDKRKPTKRKHWHFRDFKRKRLMNWRAVNVCRCRGAPVCMCWVNANRNVMQSIGKYVSRMQPFTLLSTCPPSFDFTVIMQHPLNWTSAMHFYAHQ